MKVCGKNIYHTKLGAKIALARLTHADHGEVRIYWCKRCHGYHLTSMPLGD